MHHQADGMSYTGAYGKVGGGGGGMDTPQGTLSLRRAVWVLEYRRNSAAYIHTFVTYHLTPPPPHTHHFFLLFDCYIPLLGPLSFTNDAFDSV